MMTAATITETATASGAATATGNAQRQQRYRNECLTKAQRGANDGREKNDRQNVES